MNHHWKKFAFIRVLVIVLVMSFTLESFAQNNPPGAAGEQRSRSALGGPRRQLATILFAGLGGAILGLSTLSFYGRPQDNLSNIAMGFAFGVIAGTTYVTYKAATDPTILYGLDPMREMDESGRGFAINGHEMTSSSMRAPTQAGFTTPKLGLTFEF